MGIYKDIDGKYKLTTLNPMKEKIKIAKKPKKKQSCPYCGYFAPCTYHMVMRDKNYTKK